MNEVDPVALRKSRRFLLLIGLIFAAPMIIAGVLSWSGWHPGVKGNGHPILPQRNFVAEKVQIQLDDGSLWPWRDTEPRFTLVALAGPDCAAKCFQTLTGIAQARVMLNRNQSRLRLLYLGTPPADAAQREAMRPYWTVGHNIDGKLDAYVPTTPDSVSAVLVESNGTALAWYPAGFEVPGLLRDMVKVIK